MEPIITKVSDTAIEIKTIIPEEVIPQKEETVVVSLSELKEKKAALEAKVLQTIEYKKTPQAELDKIDGDIARLQDEILETQGLIDEAIRQGVVENMPAEVTPE